MYPKVTAAQRQEAMVFSHACKLFTLNTFRHPNMFVAQKNYNHWHEGGRRKMLPEKKHLQKAEEHEVYTNLFVCQNVPLLCLEWHTTIQLILFCCYANCDLKCVVYIHFMECSIFNATHSIFFTLPVQKKNQNQH